MQTTRKTTSLPPAHSLGLAALLLLGLAAAPPTQAQTYTINTLASFSGNNGNGPNAGVTVSADGTTLYATTDGGGANNEGAVFSVPVTGGTPTILASLNVPAFAANATVGGLTLIGSTLYGTVQGDEFTSNGEVYSVPVSGGTPTVVADFNNANGVYPIDGLTLIGSTFYGTTYRGGNSGNGEVFSVPVAGGVPTAIASFNGANGASPFGGLTLGANGTLYGTTTTGGANNDGTVFSIPVGGRTLTTLATFNGTNGGVPGGDLTLIGSTLYGVSASGGANNDGTVFSVPMGGGTPTDLVSFNGTNGSGPRGTLTLSGGTLYGTTLQGGVDNDGTIFSLTLNGSGAPVPEASSLVSFGLLLLGGLGGAILRARKRSAAV